MKFILAFFLFFSLQSFSQELHPDFHTLDETQQDALLFSDQVTKISIDQWQTDPILKQQFLETLNKQAQYHFDIWGDTILGGDYTELGHDWKLREVWVYLIDQKVAAFSGIVANQAVYYGDEYCDYEYFELNDQWNQECLEKNKGEIRERFFIDTKGSSFWPSSNMYSDFYFDNGRTQY